MRELVAMNARDSKIVVTILVMALLLTSIPVIVSSTSYAQETEEVHATSSATGTDEVSAASGSNRFVVWADNTPGNFEIFIRRSTDNGVTWKEASNLSNNPGASISPRLAVSGANIYVIWQQINAAGTLSDIFFRSSLDNGVTWKSIINISQNPGYSVFAEIAVSGSNVYVAWSDTAPGNNDILFRRSSNYGATWKAVVNLSNNGGISNVLQLAASGSNLIVAWQDFTPGNWEILVRSSQDSGASWKSVKNISNTPNLSFIRQVAASGSNLYVTWSDYLFGEEDILFRRSTDGGATWKSAINLSSNDDTSDGVVIAVSGSNVYVAWSDRSLGNYEILFRRSTDSGATWKPVINISNDAEISRFPQLDASGTNVFIVWVRVDASADTYFRRSTDSGTTWKSKVNLSSAVGGLTHSPHYDKDGTLFGSLPQLGVSGSSVFVVWEHIIVVGEAPDILLKRSTDGGATWKAVKNLSNNAGDSEAPQVAL